jgi:hypothetical protein
MRVLGLPAPFSRQGVAGLLLAALSVLNLFAQEPAPVPVPPEEEREAARFRARSGVLDAAHALAVAENGTRRSGPWEGWLGAEGETVIPLQLFRGHSYHLILGTSSEDGGILAVLFDGLGKRCEVDTTAGGGRIILTVAPASSGTYFLRLRSAPGDPGAAVALTYVYR